MRRITSFSLRVQLLLLVLLAVIPAFGLIIYSAAQQRHLAAAEAQKDAMRVVRSAAAEYEQTLEDTRELLMAVSHLPALRTGDSTAASAFFADLLKQHPAYGNLAAFHADGDLFATALPFGEPLNARSMITFQRVLQTRGPAAGNFKTGVISHKAVLPIGYPVLDEAGRVRAVLIISLDVAWLNQRAAQAQLPSGSTLTLLDQSGTILARYPNPERWVGNTAPELLNLTVRHRPEGTAEVLGPDGVPRLFAFAPLGKGTKTPATYLLIGIPKKVAFAGADRLLARNLVVMGLVGLFTLLLAWFGSDAFLLQRVRALVQATKGLSAGDLSVRSGLLHAGDELGQLARAFDQMAGSLEQLTHRHTLILSAVGEGIFGGDREGKIIFANPAAARMLGYTVPELIGQNAHTLMHHSQPDGRPYPPEECPVNRTLQEGTVQQVAGEVYWRKDGTCFPVEYVSTPIWEHGEIVGSVVLVRDITERKQAEDALRESEEKWRSLVENAPSFISIVDRDGAIQYLNRVQPGTTPDKVIGRRIFDYAPTPEERETAKNTFERVYETGVPASYEMAAVVPHRPLTWYTNNIGPIRRNGEIVALMVISTDITARKRVEEERLQLLVREQAVRLEAEAAQQRYRDLVNGLDAIVWEVDADTFRFTFVSQQAEKILGYPVEQWLTEPGFWSNHIHPDDREWAVGFCKRAIAERRDHAFEYRMVAANGHLVWLSDVARVITDASGNVSQLRGVMVNITVQKQSARELEAARQRVLDAEVDKKRFTREVLRAVTQGKFHLVEAAEIPVEGRMVLEVPLAPSGNYAMLRKQLRAIAEHAGMAPESSGDLVLATGEAVTNAIKHAAEGSCRVYETGDRLIVQISDQGHGIRSEDIPAAVLERGFSTKVSLGMGYTLMLSLVDTVWLATGPEGTVVQLEKRLQPEPQQDDPLLAILDRF